MRNFFYYMHLNFESLFQRACSSNLADTPKKFQLIITMFIFLLGCTIAYSQGCVQGIIPKNLQFVCYDGRSLTAEDGQLIWYARRGCFPSTIPCCAYHANHYGRYLNRTGLEEALARCRHNYPFHLGEMQTH